MNAHAQRAWLAAGDRLERFTIHGMLGKGENAQVYRAFHPNYKRDVAIKVFHPDITRSESLTPVFKHQANAIISLKHPNIMRVLDAGITGDSYFIVMELIEGTTLRDMFATHPRGFEREEALHLFRQIASAAAYAHEQGIVHGNIKPDNVLLAGKNRPILTDFNIPCFREHPSGRGGAATPVYLAPEQAKQSLVSIQGDIYALGITLYEIVTGDVPFKGKTFNDIIQQHLQAEPAAPGKITVGLDPRIENTILTALEKEPSARFASVRDMLGSLESDADDNPFETVSLTRDDMAQVHKRPAEIRNFERSRAADLESKTSSPTPITESRTLIIGIACIAIIAIVAILLVMLT